MGLGGLLGDPFFTGALSAATRQRPGVVSLNGREYPIDLKLYSHASQETLRDGAVVSSEPNDSLFNAQGAWSRYRYNWRLGASQEAADIGETASEARFCESVGIDPWTDNQLTLLPSMTQVSASADPTYPMFMCRHDDLTLGTGVVYGSNTTLRFLAVPSDTDVAVSGGLDAPLLSLTSDGRYTYVLTQSSLRYGSNVNIAAGLTTFSTPVTHSVTSGVVGFVGNRLLMARGNALVEVSATGSITNIFTHYNTSFGFTSIFAVGSTIYVGGYSAARSELYALTVDSSTGNLIRGQEAMQLPPGEQLLRAYGQAGIVILCTSAGVRLAQVSGDGTLTYGPVLNDYGASRAAALDGRFAWFGVTSHPSGGKGVGRMALDRFVETLQPAFASDVYVATAANVAVDDVLRIDGVTYMALRTLGVYKSSSTQTVLSGWLSSGELYFGTIEDKALTELKVVAEPLLSNQSVSAVVVDDRDITVATATQDEVGTEEAIAAINGVSVRTAEVTVTLTCKTTGVASPVLRFWRLRAYPVAPPVVQWVVPLIIHTRVLVGDGEGDELALDPLEEVGIIRTWFETKEQVTYQEGSTAYRVRVDAFELKAAKWIDDGEFFEHTLIVRLVSA